MNFPDDITFAAELHGTGYGADEWHRESNLWKVTIGWDGRTHQVDFWMGAGLVDAEPCRPMNRSTFERIHKGARQACDHFGPGKDAALRPRRPQRDEVLSSLASDCRLGDQLFEDFCDDLGYDTDSRKAYAAWEACRRQVLDLRRLFGQHFTDFLDREWED